MTKSRKKDQLGTESLEPDAALVDACRQNSSAKIAAALGDIARRERKFTHIARSAQLNRSGLYRSFSLDGDPHLSTLCKVMAKLGYRLEPYRVREE